MVVVAARIYNLSTLNVETKNKNNVFVGDGFFYFGTSKQRAQQMIEWNKNIL